MLSTAFYALFLAAAGLVQVQANVPHEQEDL
jgi:hypothetical protein